MRACGFARIFVYCLAASGVMACEVRDSHPVASKKILQHLGRSSSRRESGGPAVIPGSTPGEFLLIYSLPKHLSPCRSNCRRFPLQQKNRTDGRSKRMRTPRSNQRTGDLTWRTVSSSGRNLGRPCTLGWDRTGPLYEMRYRRMSHARGKS